MINVIAMVMDIMDIVKRLKVYYIDIRDGHGDGSDGLCYKIEAVMHVIDVMALVMDLVIGLKL